MELRLSKRITLPGLVLVSLVIIALLIFAAVLGPWLPLPDPYHQDIMGSMQGPSLAHWLGTDQFGRDQLARIVAGARMTLLIGVGSVALGLVVGTLSGMLAGYFLGWFDAVFSRVIDVLLAFPTIILALGVVAVAGPGFSSLILAVGLRSIPVFGRVARGQTLTLRDREFIQAARAVGAPWRTILGRHVFPNIVNALLIVATLQVATAILIGATLTFLGVGLSAEIPEWGAMLNAGRPHMLRSPQLVLVPGVTLMLVMMAFNVVGDYLRDRLDPRLRT